MREALQRRPLHIRGAGVAWPRLLALHGEQLALVEGRDLLLLATGVSAGEVRTRRAEVLGWAPERVLFSASGRFVLLESPHGNFVSVLDAESGQPVAELAAPESLRVTVAKIEEEDLLVCSRRAGVLEGLRLPSLEVVFRADCSRPTPFVFERLAPMSDLRSFAVVGHAWAEPLDMLLLFDVGEVVADPDVVETVVGAEGVVTGETLFVGRGSSGAVPVLVRADDPNVADQLLVASFATGSVRESHPIPRGEDPSPTLGLSARGVVLGSGGILQVVPTGDSPGRVHQLPSRTQALDLVAPRLVHTAEEGIIELVDLAPVPAEPKR